MKKTIVGKLLNFGHNFVVDNIYGFLSDRQVDICEFFVFQRKIPNLENPKTFTEKMQWIKIHGRLERYSKYVDKYEVRDFIGKSIGQKYLIPLIGAWDKFEDIDFDTLPRQFVLKATHGSHYIYICKDKLTIDTKDLKKTGEKWLHESFYRKYREIQYRDCQPRIICEEYLEEESGGLTDYKIFCFNGKPHFIELVTERYSEMKDDILDLNWKKLPITSVGYHGLGKKFNIKKPRQLKAMLDIAKQLSKTFPFVRVDLYLVKEQIYFGELTFTPGNGVERFDPPEAEYQLGNLLDLSKYNSNILSEL